MRFTAGIALLILGWCVSASAQSETKQPFTLPGSAWNTTGNVSPTEGNNVISASYVEQGVTVFHGKTLSLVPYVSLGATLDTEGNDWDNRFIATSAIKLVKNVSSGIISISGGYTNEYRFKSGMRKGAPVAQAMYWFGWGSNKRFPGNSWGVLGNISPVERNNLIATAYVQQGIAVAKFHNTLLVPFAEATLSKDSDGNDWNNRTLMGSGVKLVILGGPQTSEVGVSYTHERRFDSGLTASAVTAFARFWIGWR